MERRPLPPLNLLNPPLPDDGDPTPDAPPTLLITGAGGVRAKWVVEEWCGQCECLLLGDETDQSDDQADCLIRANLSVWDESWTAYFDEVDVVLHLAESPETTDDWSQLTLCDLDSSFNVLHAAAAAGVDRIILLSTPDVLGDQVVRESTATEAGSAPFAYFAPPPRPCSARAAVKWSLERLARSLSDAAGLNVVVLRVGPPIPSSRSSFLAAIRRAIEDPPEDPFQVWTLPGGDPPGD